MKAGLKSFFPFENNLCGKFIKKKKLPCSMEEKDKENIEVLLILLDLDNFFK